MSQQHNNVQAYAKQQIETDNGLKNQTANPTQTQSQGLAATNTTNQPLRNAPQQQRPAHLTRRVIGVVDNVEQEQQIQRQNQLQDGQSLMTNHPQGPPPPVRNLQHDGVTQSQQTQSGQQHGQLSRMQQVYIHQKDDTRYCHDYTEDNFKRMVQLEQERQPLIHPAYMSSQTNINVKYREVLIDWLSSIRTKYGLKADTLCLAVNLIDRFLSVSLIEKSQLQLLGCTALWVSSKYEEIYPPSLEDLVVAADKNYQAQQFVSFERLLVQSLKFQLTMSYPHQFAERFVEAIPFQNYGYTDEEEIKEIRVRLIQVCDFILESSYQHYCLAGTLPSRLAASALVIALQWTGFCQNDYYPRIVSQLCGHQYSFLHICVVTLWQQITRVQQEQF
eukprot:UN02093